MVSMKCLGRCGAVLEESGIVEGLQFAESSGGGMAMVCLLVSLLLLLLLLFLMRLCICLSLVPCLHVCLRLCI